MSDTRIPWGFLAGGLIGAAAATATVHTLELDKANAAFERGRVTGQLDTCPTPSRLEKASKWLAE